MYYKCILIFKKIIYDDILPYYMWYGSVSLITIFTLVQWFIWCLQLPGGVQLSIGDCTYADRRLVGIGSAIFSSLCLARAAWTASVWISEAKRKRKNCEQPVFFSLDLCTEILAEVLFKVTGTTFNIMGLNAFLQSTRLIGISLTCFLYLNIN